MKTTWKFFALRLVISAFFSMNAQAETVYTGSESFGVKEGTSFVMPDEILSSGNLQARYIQQISLKVSYRIRKNPGDLGSFKKWCDNRIRWRRWWHMEIH